MVWAAALGVALHALIKKLARINTPVVSTGFLFMVKTLLRGVHRLLSESNLSRHAPAQRRIDIDQINFDRIDYVAALFLIQLAD